VNPKIWLGYWDGSFAEPIWYPSGQAHGLICIPTRGGKTRDYLAQVLATWQGSCLVIDPKGQAAAISARYRKEVLGQDVCVLNPFNILQKYLKGIRHATYDPVTSQLDPKSDTLAADADNLVEGLMPHGGPEVHWIDSARMLGSGLAINFRESYDRVPLPAIYKTICSPHLYANCEEIIADPDVSEEAEARLGRFSGKTAAENREIHSIVSAAITRLGFLGNKPIARSMSESTVDFREMKRRPMTVYVILPGKYLLPYAAWMRTITNSFADAMLDEEGGSIPVLGVLDEFAKTVGNLNAISTLNAMGAGYGVQLITVIQNLCQLKELMPKNWETYLSNCGFQIYGPNRDGTTSEYLSRMAGTVEVQSASKSFGRDFSVSSRAEGKRYLLPEETRELSDNEALVFCDGVPGVIRAGRRPYYESPEFMGKFDDDPYHATKH
jgi:type IV secretion system protein VirD4